MRLLLALLACVGIGACAWAAQVGDRHGLTHLMLACALVWFVMMFLISLDQWVFKMSPVTWGKARARQRREARIMVALCIINVVAIFVVFVTQY